MSTSLVDCGLYVKGERLPGFGEPHQAMWEVHRHRGGFVWCGLHDPDDDTLAEIAEVFGLVEKALTHAVRVHHRPRLAFYGKQLCMVVKTVRYVAHDEQEMALVLFGQPSIVYLPAGQASRTLAACRSRLGRSSSPAGRCSSWLPPTTWPPRSD